MPPNSTKHKSPPTTARTGMTPDDVFRRLADFFDAGGEPPIDEEYRTCLARYAGGRTVVASPLGLCLPDALVSLAARRGFPITPSIFAAGLGPGHFRHEALTLLDDLEAAFWLTLFAHAEHLGTPASPRFRLPDQDAWRRAWSAELRRIARNHGVRAAALALAT